VRLDPVRQASPERFQKQHVLFGEHQRNPGSIASWIRRGSRLSNSIT
jgi:hypothetical protein